MTEFECASCKTNVVAAVATAPPADLLCMECRVIAEAEPEDRAALARIFRKTPPPVPVAIQRLMDEVRAEEYYPAAYDRAHNRHNRGPIDAPDPIPDPIPPPAIQRLMDEVRAGDATPHGLFDRAHNRHNRS